MNVFVLTFFSHGIILHKEFNECCKHYRMLHEKDVKVASAMSKKKLLSAAPLFTRGFHSQ